MNENPRYREIWEKIKELPFHKTTEIILDLEAKLAESKSKLRVSNSHLASSQLEYNKLKKEYDEQEKLLSEKMASNSRLQFDFDQLKQQLAEKEKEIKEVMGNVVGLAKSREIIALEKVQRFIDDEIEIPNDIGALMLADFFNKEIEKIKTSETYVSYEQSQNQTAIDKLEKVIKFMKTKDECGFFPEQMRIAEYINQQISNLKGEDK